MEKVEKQVRNVSHKSFLLILKYIPYIISIVYIISTIGGFFGLNLVGLGYIFSMSFSSWLFMLLASFIFKYCVIHRLPLYYIALNDVLNITDYYIEIPVETATLFKIHLLVIFGFISLYTYLYVKNSKKSFIVDN